MIVLRHPEICTDRLTVKFKTADGVQIVHVNRNNSVWIVQSTALTFGMRVHYVRSA